MTGLVASELRACEQVIERGLATFVDVGRALMRIRDSRLYRDGYTSFEEYCRDRWGMDRISAHRHIDAAKAVLSMDNTGAPLPVNVGQVRELAPIRDTDPRRPHPCRGAAGTCHQPDIPGVGGHRMTRSTYSTKSGCGPQSAKTRAAASNQQKGA